MKRVRMMVSAEAERRCVYAESALNGVTKPAGPLSLVVPFNRNRNRTRHARPRLQVECLMVLSWYNTISYYRILRSSYITLDVRNEQLFLLRQIFCTVIEYHVMIMPPPTSGLTH
jgi:hypothetical protein